MNLLDKAALLNGSGRKKERVELPELDGFVYVRALTIPEFQVIVAQLSSVEVESDPAKYAAAHLAAYVCDEDGQAILNLEEAESFVRKHGAAIPKRIVNVGNKLNSLNDAALERAAGE